MSIDDTTPTGKAKLLLESSRAQELRKDNWKEHPDVMKRVIPVFQALIDSDPIGEYHRFRGQLGYSLKDQPQPDWKGAEKALSMAIDMRGPWEKGWVLYEFNRALCRIAQCKAGDVLPNSQANVKSSIIADLRIAIKGQLLDTVLGNPTIKSWLEAEKVNPKELEKDESHPGG
jgi:hypothetical protein